MLYKIVLFCSLIFTSNFVYAKKCKVNENNPSNTINLEFLHQPTNSYIGQNNLNSIVLLIKDNCGNIVNKGANSQIDVYLTLTNNIKRAKLLGLTKVKARQGVALFSDLGIDLPGTGLRITANSENAGPATSNNFNVY